LIPTSFRRNRQNEEELPSSTPVPLEIDERRRSDPSTPVPLKIDARRGDYPFSTLVLLKIDRRRDDPSSTPFMPISRQVGQDPLKLMPGGDDPSSTFVHADFDAGRGHPLLPRYHGRFLSLPSFASTSKLGWGHPLFHSFSTPGSSFTLACSPASVTHTDDDSLASKQLSLDDDDIVRQQQ